MTYRFPTKEEIEQNIDEKTDLPEGVGHALKEVAIAQLEYFEAFTDALNNLDDPLVAEVEVSQIPESNEVEELQDQIEFLEKLLLASYGPDWAKMTQFDCEQKRKQLRDLQTP